MSSSNSKQTLTSAKSSIVVPSLKVVLHSKILVVAALVEIIIILLRWRLEVLIWLEWLLVLVIRRCLSVLLHWGLWRLLTPFIESVVWIWLLTWQWWLRHGSFSSELVGWRWHLLLLVIIELIELLVSSIAVRALINLGSWLIGH